MPFIALCPHCRVGKVQAPKRKQGLLHTCPKCQADFHLLPMGDSNLPVDYKLPPEEFDLSAAYEEEPATAFATARTQVQRPLNAATSATPSEVLPIPPKQSEPAPRDYTPTPTGPEPPVWLALAAGAVFGLAMIATQFPYGRFIALPLLILGGLLGLLAVFNFESSRKRIGYAAISVNVLGLILVLLLPDWLRMGPWLLQGDPNSGPKPVLAVPRDGSQPIPAEWIDIQKYLWQQDDVRVDLVSAKVEPLNPKAKPPDKLVLRLTLKVNNIGVARAIRLQAESPEAAPKLTVRSGPMVAFVKTESKLPLELLPGKDAEIVLVFEAPAFQGEALSLEYPAASLGVSEPAKLTIPAAMLVQAARKKP